MCNINVVIRRDGQSDPRITQLINMMSAVSFEANNDGNGFFDLNTRNIYKKPSKCFFDKETWGVISHERFTTSGLGRENVQPLRRGDITLIHNGVLSGRGTDKLSDTHEFLIDIKNEMGKDKTLIEAIKKEMEHEYGSYSIFMEDKREERLLYFKNPTTGFYYICSKDWIIGSTIKYNVEMAKAFLNLQIKTRTPEPYIIFDVLKGMSYIDKIPKVVWESYPKTVEYLPTVNTATQSHPQGVVQISNNPRAYYESGMTNDYGEIDRENERAIREQIFSSPSPKYLKDDYDYELEEW